MNENDFQEFVGDILKGCEENRQIAQRHNALPSLAEQQETVIRIAHARHDNNEIIANRLAMQSVVKISEGLINDPTIRERIKSIASNTLANLKKQIEDSHTILAEEPNPIDFEIPNLPQVELKEEPEPPKQAAPPRRPSLVPSPEESEPIRVPSPDRIFPRKYGFIRSFFQSFLDRIMKIFSTEEEVIDIEELEPIEQDPFPDTLAAGAVILAVGFIFSKLLRKYYPELSTAFTNMFIRTFSSAKHSEL